MKRIYLSTLLFCIVATHKVNAQNRDSLKRQKSNHFELAIGYGNWSLVQLIEGVYNGEDGFDSRPIKNRTGPISITGKYVFGQWMAAGIAIAYENDKGDMKRFVNSSSNGALTSTQGAFKRNTFTIVPEFYFRYPHTETKYASAYGYAGVGVTLLNELDIYSLDYYNSNYYNGVNSLGNRREIVNNKYEVTLQICLLGLSFGGKVRGFAELGFGYKGIINGGLLVKI